ncbi:hypothetical protein [Xanthomonas phage BsXeu269p/3]|nr:hypothetical protein [Xanthomonas phage BsXeu269p/3]
MPKTIAAMIRMRLSIAAHRFDWAYRFAPWACWSHELLDLYYSLYRLRPLKH